jgi:RNA polymerase sigma factor (sigma-70 family)
MNARPQARSVSALLALSPTEVVAILQSAHTSSPDPQLADVLDAFRRQWDHIARWRYRQLGDSIEDAIQVALTKLVSPDKLRWLVDPSGVERWGWTLFANTAVDFLRDLGREHERRVGGDGRAVDVDELLRQRLPDLAPTPEEAVIARARVVKVLEMIGRVDAARLRWLEDLPEQEVAERLGTSRDAVAGQLKRLRRQLRELLERP